MFISSFFRRYEWERAIYFKTFLHWATLDEPYAVLTRWPLLHVMRGHMRSHSFFLPLTFDRIEIVRWGWYQYVSFAQTHRLICNITYLSRHVTSPHDLDLRSNSDIYFLGSTRLDEGTRCCQNCVTSFVSWKVICEKKNRKKLFWPILSSLD